MRARMEMQSRKRMTLSSQLSLVIAAHGAFVYATIAVTGSSPSVPAPRRIDTIPFVVTAPPTVPVDGGSGGVGFPSRPAIDVDVLIDPGPPLTIEEPLRPTDGVVDIGWWATREVGGGKDSVGGPARGAYASHRVDTPPRLLSEVIPEYPESMSRVGIGGRVILDFVVDTTGRVRRESVTVVVASNPAFVTAATTAIVEQARFSPGRVGETPVPTLVRQGVVFRHGRQ